MSSTSHVTEIGSIQQGEYRLRNQSITDLIEEYDWIATMWLAWTGRVVTPAERTLLSACLVACVDHGVDTPSTQATRESAERGQPLAGAVAAGLQKMGPEHGQAGSSAARWLREVYKGSASLEGFAQQELERGAHIPGFGHRIYTIDPRSSALYRLAKKTLASTPYFDFAWEVERVLTRQKDAPLPLNIDGALGAIMLDLGAPIELADALFVVARCVGLTAHAREVIEAL